LPKQTTQGTTVSVPAIRGSKFFDPAREIRL